MVERYPYDLYVKEVIASGRNEKGNAIQGQEVYTWISKCRDEAKTSKPLSTVAGEAYEVSHNVLCPVDCPAVAAGTTIEVRKGSSVRLNAKVIGFKQMQLHCRIWA